MMQFALFGVLFLSFLPSFIWANTECVWATGRILCQRNQSKVLGAQVELWDLDSPQNSQWQNPMDPDDKAAFTLVDDPNGLWRLEGCASDHDWWPGQKNQPEFYLRVHHTCNTPAGEWLTIWPAFRVYTPRTYDWHVEHPIVLDAPKPMAPNSNADKQRPISTNGQSSSSPRPEPTMPAGEEEEDGQNWPSPNEGGDNFWAELSQNMKLNRTK